MLLSMLLLLLWTVLCVQLLQLFNGSVSLRDHETHAATVTVSDCDAHTIVTAVEDATHETTVVDRVICVTYGAS